MIKQRAGLGRAASRILSDGSLTKKASLNAAAAVVDQGARFFLGLVVNPFLVSRLGDSAFGIWQVLQRMVGHASAASGRPGEALKWSVAHDQASTDHDLKRRHVGNAVAVWVLFLPVLLAVGGVLTWFAPAWLGVPAGSFGTVRLTAGILVLDLVLFSLAYLPQSVLQGENLGYKRLGLSTSLVFVGKALIVTAVYLEAGIVGMATATVTMTFLSGLMYVYITRSRVPWFGIARPSLRTVGRFVRLSWWFLLWNLVMQLMLASDVVVLGVMGSPALVTTYALAKYVPHAITVAVATFVFAIMPGLGRLVGAGDLERAARVRNETMTLVWLLTTVAGATVLLWEESFLRLWVGQRYYPGGAAVLAIILMVFQFALIRTDANVIDLTLNLRRKVLLGALSAGLSLGLAWAFLGPLGMGIPGLALGFVAGRSLLSFAYPWMVGRMLGIPPTAQAKAVVRPGLTTAALFSSAALLATPIRAESWPVFLASVIGTSATVAAVALFAGLPAPARRRVWRRLRKVVRHG